MAFAIDHALQVTSKLQIQVVDFAS